MAALPHLFTAALALSVCTGLPAHPAKKNQKEQKRVECAADRHFMVLADGRRAQVVWDNRHAVLLRKLSSLGERYESTRAALIIDGAFVAFVPNGDLGWEDCYVREVTPASYP